MSCDRKQHHIPTRLALLVWAATGRAVQGIIEASVAYTALLLALAPSLALSARGIYLTSQDLGIQPRWPSSQIQVV